MDLRFPTEEQYRPDYIEQLQELSKHNHVILQNKIRNITVPFSLGFHGTNRESFLKINEDFEENRDGAVIDLQLYYYKRNHSTEVIDRPYFLEIIQRLILNTNYYTIKKDEHSLHSIRGGIFVFEFSDDDFRKYNNPIQDEEEMFVYNKPDPNLRRGQIYWDLSRLKSRLKGVIDCENEQNKYLLTQWLTSDRNNDYQKVKTDLFLQKMTDDLLKLL